MVRPKLTGHTSMMSSDKNESATSGTDTTTHFGFRTVAESEKAGMVKGVFNSVADRYDVMNDFMSAGVHRLWKDSLINSLNPRAGMQLLDVAGGTGDIAFRFLEASDGGHVTVCDINAEMLRVGKGRAEAKGYADRADFVCGDAQKLPFENRSMDAYTIAFGIRNVTRVHEALAEAYRVLKPSGRFLCLEFSPVVVPILQKAYDAYSFNVIPKMGGIITKDEESYQYLVESIRRFPAPQKFAEMISEAGFSRVGWRSMSAGVVALHTGVRI
ncbi:MAG: bifunctional demethylmenaquinone methyltransferase/2-methoxy-6-polyprenyl-1,4-benzoquinol methylase UbiE [Alphaproteobacteria bacterium]|nr:MAG: bifunctional demethylmenaquinone methyltransferase/2-methoxy-6-polyprenyl-1,4-benzoquinol methylase UbiE [Alphaproteobacteria bacterium]